MLLSSLLLIPLFGVLVILVNKDNGVSLTNVKLIALTTSIVNLFISLVIFILFDFSTNQFQFVQEYHEISYFDFYLGVDGLSIYFVLLTTIIIPISLLSNWTSISKDVESYVIIILLLEALLLAVFLVLDILLFYIFFESILPPLFILIGIFGSDNRVKASFYLFLYTLLGSLFLLLSILAMSSIMSTTDFDTLFKGNFIYLTQLFLFYGIFIAFAVKTPTIFLNTWLLKAHVESPLGGSIILAAIVLKLSLYGILRLILPVLPKAYMEYTYIIYLIGVITIIYASLSTLRTIDVKELIAYSSVSHAAVYLLGVFSNSLQGIEGGINLGLAHGLVSPGLFICAGGILYDRSHTRLIAFYRGMAQIMPLFAIFFFILCLANCGSPLTLNFIGEFLSLYGVFEQSLLFGVFASFSIVFSAGYTIFMYQKISFGGSYSRTLTINIPDLNKREFMTLITLVVLTVFLGIYPAIIIDGLNYSVTTLIYSLDLNLVNCDAPNHLGIFLYGTTVICWKFIICIGLIISVAAIALFLHIVFLQLVKGKAVFGYPLAVPQQYSDYLRRFKDLFVPFSEFALHSPPKPHAFTSSPLQSAPPQILTAIGTLRALVAGIPNAVNLMNQNNNDPRTINNSSKTILDQVNRDAGGILEQLRDARKVATTVQEKREITRLSSEVRRLRHQGVEYIKEANNTAIDIIDDSGLNYYLFNTILPVFDFSFSAFLPELFAFLSALFSLLLPICSLLLSVIIFFGLDMEFIVPSFIQDIIDWINCLDVDTNLKSLFLFLLSLRRYYTYYRLFNRIKSYVITLK